MPKGVYKRNKKESDRLRTLNLGREPWNKGKKIGSPSQETRLKLSKARVGKLNPKWKGNNVGYDALHTWLRRSFGAPTICEDCGITETECSNLQWANKTGEYRRNRNDWLQLCPRCHKKYDNHSEKIKQAWKDGRYEFHSHNSNQETAEAE